MELDNPGSIDKGIRGSVWQVPTRRWEREGSGFSGSNGQHPASSLYTSIKLFPTDKCTSDFTFNKK